MFKFVKIHALHYWFLFVACPSFGAKILHELLNVGRTVKEVFELAVHASFAPFSFSFVVFVCCWNVQTEVLARLELG